ncbi:hypothetical protein RsTz2092_09720 [Deferribacterales bacterium RsTz2092]|nr:hypothetical protein AGMMS49941_10320 [Deferribacterales bacterium]
MYEEVVADAKRDVAVMDVDGNPYAELRELEKQAHIEYVKRATAAIENNADADLKKLAEDAYWEYVKRTLDISDLAIARGDVYDGEEVFNELINKYGVQATYH